MYVQLFLTLDSSDEVLEVWNYIIEPTAVIVTGCLHIEMAYWIMSLASGINLEENP